MGRAEYEHRCLAPTRHDRHRRDCLGIHTAAVVDFNANEGTNSFAFKGRVPPSVLAHCRAPRQHQLGVPVLDAKARLQGDDRDNVKRSKPAHLGEVDTGVDYSCWGSP